MKMLKRISAILLVGMFLFSVAGCHPKDEIAVTVGNEKFTSAYYMCSLIYADMEARQKVDEAKADDENADAAETDYYAEKIDKTDFSKWVKNRALEMLKEIAAYKTKCSEEKLTLSEEEKNNAEMYASYYWSNYGYAQLFEPNGVSEATFKKYMTDASYANLYFDHLYGKEGTKALSDETVAQTMQEKFLLANQLEVTFSEETDEEKAAKKAQLDGYVTALQKGTRTFEEIYHEFNGNEHQEDAEAETEADDGTLKPINEHAAVLGAEDTSYASENFETAKAMAVGEVKLIEKADNAGYTLVVKLDLAADPYYVDQLDSAVRHLIADEAYEKDMQDFAKTLKFSAKKSAIDQFKVKKIVYPTANGQ
ncbi:MAG: hypothetical protein IKI29_03650 [Clostridia bacterium]|nr:hypothetical protein [Clostridia bacterium]